MFQTRLLLLLAVMATLLLGCDGAQKLLDDAKKQADEALATKPTTPPATSEVESPASPVTPPAEVASANTTSETTQPVAPPQPAKPTDEQIIAHWNSIAADARSDNAIMQLLEASPESLSEVTEFDFSNSGSRVTLAGFKALHKFPLVKELRVSLTEIGPDKMAEICSLPQLESLSMVRCNLTDAMMAPLSKLATLRQLNVGLNPITDAGLASINRLVEVQVISIEGTQVNGSGLLKARYLGGLRELNANHSQFAGPGYLALKSAPNLEKLDVAETNASDLFLPTLAGAKHLKVLNFRGNPAITDKGFMLLKGCINLEELYLSGTTVHDRGLAQLRNCKKLAKLYCSTDPVTKEALRKALPNCEIP